MNRSGVGILPAGKLSQARCLFHQDPCSRFPIPDSRFPIPDSRFP
ncbi:hypothetical protein [Moorena sp. SIO3B2]|nr:hypothetical protein [Moorena sp. SIO3B2]